MSSNAWPRAYAVFSAVALAGLAFVLFGGYFNFKPLLNVDWQAIGALATFVAVAAALYISNRDSRERRREQFERGTSIAMYIWPEINSLARTMAMTRRFLARASVRAIGRKKWSAGVHYLLKQNVEPLKERIDYLHFLGGETAAMVVSAVAQLERLREHVRAIQGRTAAGPVRLTNGELRRLQHGAAVVQFRTNMSARALWRLAGTGDCPVPPGSELSTEELSTLRGRNDGSEFRYPGPKKLTLT